MMGRMDVVADLPCSTCKATGVDPKKRTRSCPDCIRGFRDRCTSCGEPMPCAGTAVAVFDQTYCTLPPKGA
jgi:hypothetical protein